jgi:hypothetical protein
MTTDPPPPVPTPPTAEPGPVPAPAPKRKRRQLSAEELSDRRIRRWAELLETIILAVATLAAVWAGYQSGLWGGAQTSLNIEATTRRIAATQASARGQQAQLVDVGLFTEWINAYAEGNDELASFFQDRFRDEFQPAFDAWLATKPRENPDAPPSPFVMEEYKISAFVTAAALEAEAGQLTQEAEQAGTTSDRYTLTAVILAGALLLAGLSSRFEWEELRAVVVVAALLVLLFCVVQILLLPRV